jgi:SAM-dependent methyltransferase
MDLAKAEANLLDWMIGANAVALITALQDSGGFDSLREPLSAKEFADRLHIDFTQAQRVLMALHSLNIVELTQGQYRITDGWAKITSENRPAALGDRLGILTPLRRGLAASLNDPSDFESVEPAEAVALARSVWGVANSTEALQSWAELDAAMPEVREVWKAGGRHAEFGCGAGRDLIRIAAMYPKVRAVGYDMLEYVLDHARELAHLVSVEDRVELHCADILELNEDDAFDTIVWSHMFFGPDVRSKAIASVKRALRHGGYLIMPFMADLPEPSAVKDTSPARFQLLVAAAYARWNIYWPTGANLKAEIENEGFSHLHTIPHPRTPFMVMRYDE